MIEQPPPGIPPEPQSPPPVNQAQGCFRVMLWFIPSVFSVVSWGIWPAGFGIFAWVALNLGFIGAAGWFDTVMSRRIRLLSPEKRTGEMARSMVAFFLSQLAIIPVIVGSALFAFCALGAR
jgi:hypothetical protein